MNATVYHESEVQSMTYFFLTFSEQSELCLTRLTPLGGSVASSDSTISTRQQDAIVRFLLESAGSNPSTILFSLPANHQG